MYTKAINNLSLQENKALNDYKAAIHNLNMTGAESTLLNKINIADTGHEVDPIHSSLIPQPLPQPTYTGSQIDNSLKIYFKVNNELGPQYDIHLSAIARAQCMVLGLFGVSIAFCKFVAYTLYKKFLSTTKLYNPIKAVLPIYWACYFSFGDDLPIPTINKIYYEKG